MTTDLVEHVASLGLRRLPTEDILSELEYARREAQTAQEGYLTYQRKRVAVLAAEMQRRKALRQSPSKASLNIDFAKDLKSRVAIEDVFNDILGILCRGRGNRLTYACPAHPDKHPSGVLYTQQGRYHCYQCQADGDCFDALMAFRGMTFMQAVDAVAGYLGVELPKPKNEKKGISL
jgi:hypothetical protein